MQFELYPIQDVIKNNFNLNIARYFQEEIEGVKLRDILKYQGGTRKESINDRKTAKNS